MRLPGGHTMGIHLVVPFLLVGLLANPASLSSTRGQTLRECISAITRGNRNQVKAKANAYIQRQIGNVQSYLTAKYEPLFLENLNDLHTLTVQGISFINLIGRPKLVLSRNRVKSEVKMAFKQLNSEADLYKEIWKGFIVTGRLYTTIKGMELLAKFSFDLQRSARPTLDQVVVTNWGTVKANLVRSNVGYVDDHTVIEYVKKDTPKIIETVFKKVLRQYKVECPP